MSLSLPTDLSPRQILLNKVWLHGVILTGVFYGIAMSLCLSCLHHLSPSAETLQKKPPSSRRQMRWLRVYVMFLIVISTIYMTLKGIALENAYIHHSDYPGGPATFMMKDRSIAKGVRGTCFVLLQWASDGLLLWRCMTFFSAFISLARWAKVIIVLLSIINIGLGVIWAICFASFEDLGRSAYMLVLLYRFYTLFLHSGATLAIVIKLLHHRSTVIKILGTGHGGFYLGVISILIESAAVIVVYNVIFLVPAILRHPLYRLGRQVGIMVQIIPPLMIIQRVAQGTDSVCEMRASEIEIGNLSRLHFTTEEPEGSHAGDMARPVASVMNERGPELENHERVDVE